MSKVLLYQRHLRPKRRDREFKQFSSYRVKLRCVGNGCRFNAPVLVMWHKFWLCHAGFDSFAADGSTFDSIRNNLKQPLPKLTPVFNVIPCSTLFSRTLFDAHLVDACSVPDVLKVRWGWEGASLSLSRTGTMCLLETKKSAKWHALADQQRAGGIAQTIACDSWVTGFSREEVGSHWKRGRRCCIIEVRREGSVWLSERSSQDLR